jgi:hypothetical protein
MNEVGKYYLRADFRVAAKAANSHVMKLGATQKPQTLMQLILRYEFDGLHARGSRSAQL